MALVSSATVTCVQDPADNPSRMVQAVSEGGSSRTPGALPGAACVNIQLTAWCFLVHFPGLEDNSKIGCNTFRIRMYCSGLLFG